MFRRHGIIGGPRQRPPKPKLLPGYAVNKKQQPVKVSKPEPKEELIDVDIVIISSEEDDYEEKEDIVIEELDTFDLVEQEDVLDEYIPESPLFFECDECDFSCKSARGLSSHKRWKHPVVTEVFEPELSE